MLYEGRSAKKAIGRRPHSSNHPSLLILHVHESRVCSPLSPLASAVGLQPSGETETKEWGLRERQRERERESSEMEGGERSKASFFTTLLFRHFKIGNKIPRFGTHVTFSVAAFKGFQKLLGMQNPGHVLGWMN